MPGQTNNMENNGHTLDNLSNDIRLATTEKIKLFESIRSETNVSCQLPFWDVVVLSALDPQQKAVYELQLKEKIGRGELPSGFVKYHVIHDPVGAKVGNGGGVVAVLDELENMYGENLKQLKVLILLSGGYSQRLPSSSLLGKIFTCLPMGSPLYQMLELKLAMYIDFPSRMRSGVFVSSADCIEVYELMGDEWNFKQSGMTALAHPSPIEIGTTHGVFVLEEKDMERLNKAEDSTTTTSASSSSYVGKCRRFLHKPSRENMRTSGAVFMRKKEEYVYSDSAYFMDMETGLLLLQWYRQRGGLKCEIDAYGDFLQALGPEGTIDYCKNVKGVTLVTDNLISTREELFHLLKGTPLNVLMLEKSKFYHIGTTQEYIDNFCRDQCFRNELTFSNNAMSKVINNNDKSPLQSTTVLIQSLIQSPRSIGDDVIIENTRLHHGNSIGNKCIISNNIFPEEDITVPDGSFLHTVVVKKEEEGKVVDEMGEAVYVCVGFGIEDNVKKCCTGQQDDISMLTYAGLSLDKVIVNLNLKHNLWAEGCLLPNLWNAKLFQGFNSPQEALRRTFNMLASCRRQSIMSESNIGDSDVFYSMGDVLRLKDLDKVLQMRTQLRKDIQTAAK